MPMQILKDSVYVFRKKWTKCDFFHQRYVRMKKKIAQKKIYNVVVFYDIFKKSQFKVVWSQHAFNLCENSNPEVST